MSLFSECSSLEVSCGNTTIAVYMNVSMATMMETLQEIIQTIYSPGSQCDLAVRCTASRDLGYFQFDLGRTISHRSLEHLPDV